MRDSLTAAAAGLVSAAVALALGTIGVFREQVAALFFRPELNVSFDPASDIDLHFTITAVQPSPDTNRPVSHVQSLYARMRIGNVGETTAEKVEVMVKRIQFKDADGSVEMISGFVPMNLRWSHAAESYLEQLSPGLEKHCDLFYVLDPRITKHGQFISGAAIPSVKAMMCFTVTPIVNWGALPAGVEYVLTLTVSAANCRATDWLLTIRLPDHADWLDEEERLTGRGLVVRGPTPTYSATKGIPDA